MLSSLSKPALQIRTRLNVRPDLYTDENNAYDGLPHRHKVNHTKKKYVDGDVHVNGVESFWALAKRGYHGIYHHWSKRHAQRYMDEFAGRLNMRPMDTLDQMAEMWLKAIGRLLTWKELLKGKAPPEPDFMNWRKQLPPEDR